MIHFSLNHMTAASRKLSAFVELATSLNINKIEIRNDIENFEISDGCSASTVKKLTSGKEIITINALQKFNNWNDHRAEQADNLAKFAKDCGAQSIVLCPVNSFEWQPAESERKRRLQEALKELKGILSSHNITGLVEPLGFEECSLRYKRDAVEAIESVGGQDIFQLTHDTFHHFVAQETNFFPALTGLVHLSGVESRTLPVNEMRDEHRVLVTPSDRLGNIKQIRELLKHGYQGVFSFEPFAQAVYESPILKNDIQSSMKFISESVSDIE